MKIHVYCILRNERFILPYFLRHYEQFAEKIFVYDGDSNDGTREILAAHPLVEIRELPNPLLDDLMFAEVHSTEYRKDRSPDWVICVDADELIWHEDLVGTLKNCRAQVIVTDGWNMISEVLSTTAGQIYDEVKDGVPDGMFRKPCVFNPEIDIRFGPGRHTAEIDKGTVATGKSGIKLLHFRFLSKEYAVDRSSRNYLRLSAANRDHGFGIHNTPGWKGDHGYDWYKQALKTKVRIIHDRVETDDKAGTPAFLGDDRGLQSRDNPAS